jgi:hypothetical protein
MCDAVADLHGFQVKSAEGKVPERGGKPRWRDWSGFVGHDARFPYQISYNIPVVLCEWWDKAWREKFYWYSTEGRFKRRQQEDALRRGIS